VVNERPGGAGTGSRRRTRASARLGLTLRSVLLSPRQGFAAALANADRRARAGRRPAEGVAPFVLAAAGGATVALLWLKIGALIGVREVCSSAYLPGYIAATAVLGAIISLIAQSLWGLLGPPISKGLQTDEPERHEFRLVWGAAAFPQVFALVLLLPLDLLIVGQDSFTTTELVDPVSTAWAAFSIALGVSALIWSLFLLYRGVGSATDTTGARALAGSLGAVAAAALVVGVLVIAALFLPQGPACPT
jgi:hypothetical protein